MTIKYGYKIVKLTAVVIGFTAFLSLYSANMYASDRYYEEEVYKNIEASKKTGEEIKERQRNAMSELEKLKAQTQISRESIVDTTSGPQSYFEDMAVPETTNNAPDSKKLQKNYKYDKETGANVPQRLFKNVR